MAFEIRVTDEAERLWNQFSAREQRMLKDAVLARLREQPATPTKAVKRLRPNPVAEYELRVGDLGILYDVDMGSRQVILLIVGRKVGETLVVDGEVFHEHQANPPQSSGNGSA